MYKGAAYCAMSQFLPLGVNGYTLKFRFFCIRVYNEKLGQMLKPLVPKFGPDLSARLKDIVEKQVPARLKPIVSVQHCAITARLALFVAENPNVTRPLQGCYWAVTGALLGRYRAVTGPLLGCYSAFTGVLLGRYSDVWATS